MGREIVRVPPGFQHPLDADGSPIPGAQRVVLHEIDLCDRTAYQIYENVTEGCPVSPVFDSREELVSWLAAQGGSLQVAEAFVEAGSAPSFVVRLPGSESS